MAHWPSTGHRSSLVVIVVVSYHRPTHIHTHTPSASVYHLWKLMFKGWPAIRCTIYVNVLMCVRLGDVCVQCNPMRPPAMRASNVKMLIYMINIYVIYDRVTWRVNNGQHDRVKCHPSSSGSVGWVFVCAHNTPIINNIRKRPSCLTGQNEWCVAICHTYTTQHLRVKAMLAPKENNGARCSICEHFLSIKSLWPVWCILHCMYMMYVHVQYVSCVVAVYFLLFVVTFSHGIINILHIIHSMKHGARDHIQTAGGGGSALSVSKRTHSVCVCRYTLKWCTIRSFFSFVCSCSGWRMSFPRTHATAAATQHLHSPQAFEMHVTRLTTL